MVPRVHERLAYLTKIGNEGTPGRFARLLNSAGELAAEYLKDRDAFRDRYAAIHRIQSTDVTGHGYSWMTNHHSFHPGGNFVTIPNEMQGGLGGNHDEPGSDRK